MLPAFLRKSASSTSPTFAYWFGRRPPYSASKEKSLYIYTRDKGINSSRLGAVAITSLGADFRLSTEIRSNMAAASMTDGTHTYSTPIVDLFASTSSAKLSESKIKAGRVGIV